MRAMFPSITSRSTRSAGVSSADVCWPISMRDESVRVSIVRFLCRYRRALQPGGPIGVLDQAQRFEIVGRVGLEWRARLEATDEMRDDAIEARLVAALVIVAPAAGLRPVETELRVCKRRARLAADDFHAIKRARRKPPRHHGARYLDGRPR